MKKVVSLVLVCALTLGLTACSGGKSPAPSSSGDTAAQTQASADKSQDGAAAAPANTDEPIVIGFLGWSSGPDSLYGLVPQYLLTDYFKEVNLNGGWLGREIDFRTYDVSGLGGDFSEAVNATNKLIQAGVDVIIGPSNSTQSTAVAEICNREGVLHIPSGSSAIVTVDEKGETRPWTFRAGPENSDFLINIANYTYHELNNPKVAVLYETTQIDCVNMRDTYVDTLEGLGGTFVGEATYQIDDQEFRAQLRNLAEKDPDYIFMPAMGYKEIGYVANQLKELGYADEIKLMTISTADNADLLTLAGPALEGCIFNTTADMSSDRFTEITKQYYENHGASGMSLHVDGLVSFNEAKLVEYAINTAGATDPEAMRKALEEADYIDLITCPVQGYDEHHNLVGFEYNVVTVQNGEFVSLGAYATPVK